jgi:glycogen debranching enzyme
MSAQLFSGWGVRTLAEGEGRYNPIDYHVGTVWPFDNSFIAWGLRKYGFKEEAARVAEGILGAAQFFGGCLPEAFGGYPRQMTKYPVQYPTACSPQAWATGAPLLLLRAVLGWSPWGTTSWSIRRCHSAWAGWSSSTSRGDGAGSTRSDAAASTRHARIPLRG